MEEFLLKLQESDFGVWVSTAPTLLAYPTILMLHTVGLAMVLGPAWVLDLRLLGVGVELPVESLRGAFRVMWLGFLINASTGVALFIAEADDKGLLWVFWVKLASIALALIVTARIKGLVFGSSRASDDVPAAAKSLAVVSIGLWLLAITAGRLMAYLK